MQQSLYCDNLFQCCPFCLSIYCQYCLQMILNGDIASKQWTGIPFWVYSYPMPIVSDKSTECTIFLTRKKQLPKHKLKIDQCKTLPADSLVTFCIDVLIGIVITFCHNCHDFVMVINSSLKETHFTKSE